MRLYTDEMEPRLKEGLGQAVNLGASAAKISYAHSSSRSVGFETNRLKCCGADDGQHYAVSLVINGRIGTAIGNVISALPEMVKRAADFAKNGAISHFTEYPEPAKDYPALNTFSDSVLKIEDMKLIDDCQSLIGRLLEADSSLVCGGGAEISEGEAISMNSAGYACKRLSTSWGMELGFQKNTGTDMLMTEAGRGWREVNSLYDLNAIYDELFFDLSHAANIVKVASGTVPLFIPPQLLGRILSPIAMGINGRNVFKGTSPLKEKLGTQCFSKQLSILDNPHEDFSFHCAQADDAGIPTQKRMLVSDGVLNCFLYDYDTAALAAATPTGNAGCSPYSMRVTPGKDSSEDIIKSIKHGIYAKHLLGFGQTNLENGDFSANLALGFLVENGEIVGRVKDTMISGNIFDLLKGDILVSSDVHPQNKQPYMLMPGVALRA